MELSGKARWTISCADIDIDIDIGANRNVVMRTFQPFRCPHSLFASVSLMVGKSKNFV
jgi:hypothetical protein